MPQETPRTLNHFAMLSCTAEYWAMPVDHRHGVLTEFLGAISGAARACHLYQASPTEAATDIVTWSAVEADEPAAARDFFGRYGKAMAPYRRYVRMNEALWGFTKPSQYTKTRSTQEIDPFATQRCPYLIIYPFVKTTEWYLKPMEERREMMMGHIKVGKQYQDITQLLLYSFGLQDQEFVVVYEADDLTRFSDLVAELRSTDARLYTQRDWPLHTAMHHADAASLRQVL